MKQYSILQLIALTCVVAAIVTLGLTLQLVRSQRVEIQALHDELESQQFETEFLQQQVDSAREDFSRQGQSVLDLLSKNLDTFTVRCNHGAVDIFGGYLAPGSKVDVYARHREGKFKLVASAATVVGKPTWVSIDGSSVHVVEILAGFGANDSIRGYFDYRLRFPGGNYAEDPQFENLGKRQDNNAMNTKPH